MVKGGQQLVMPATVTPNGREAAASAGQANIIDQMNANEPFVGGSESVTVPQFSGSPAANAASVAGNSNNIDSLVQSAGDCHATGSCMVGGKRRRKAKKSRKVKKSRKATKSRKVKKSHKGGGKSCNTHEECRPKFTACNTGVKSMFSILTGKKGTCM